MKILIIKSLFCPNETYYEMTVKSITKIKIFIDMLQKNNNENTFEMYFIGWINPKFVNQFKLYIQLCCFNVVHSEYWCINYGKYVIYNHIIDYAKKYCDEYNDTYAYYIYLDHDIHFDMTFDTIAIDIFNRVCCLKSLIINEKKLGMIALNQKDDARHQDDIYENSVIYDEFDIVWPNINGSIASGCFMICPHLWRSLEYFEPLSVYGLDDYYLAKKLTDNGYLNVVISNMYVIHPFDINNKYALWKKNHIIKLIDSIKLNDIVNTKATDDTIQNTSNNMYYQTLQESINFWSE